MIHRFVWYELLTPDPVGAAAFYCSVVGWTAQDSGLADRSYTVLNAGDAPMGGLMALPAGVPIESARWRGYIAVDDVDRFAQRVTEAAGRVYRAPEDIPGVGRFAVVADPHGAAFILFQPASDAAAPPASPTTPGHVGWHELRARDLQSAFGFYAALFGWTKAQAIEMGPMGTYQMFAAGEVTIGGMMAADAATQASWLYYVNVKALDAAAARITGAGGRILHGPQEVPGGSWILHALDPQGVTFALVAPRR